MPKTNFYRQLASVLEVDFLYNRTQQYYGKSGQKSIDPVVFFKLCLVGYLENIISDRKLIQHRVIKSGRQIKTSELAQAIKGAVIQVTKPIIVQRIPMRV